MDSAHISSFLTSGSSEVIHPFTTFRPCPRIDGIPLGATGNVADGMYWCKSDCVLVGLREGDEQHVRNLAGKQEDVRKRVSFLRNSGILPYLDKGGVMGVAAGMVKEVYTRHEVVCERDGRGEAFWFVVNGDFLIQTYSADYSDDDDNPAGGSMIKPGLETMILGPNSVIAGDVIQATPVYAETAVCHSGAGTLYRVGRELWGHFKGMGYAERVSALVYAREDVGNEGIGVLERTASLNKRFNSVRGIRRRVKDIREFLTWNVYEVEEERRRELLRKMEGGVGGMIEDHHVTVEGGRGQGQGQGENETANSGKGRKKLDPLSYVHLGPATRSAEQVNVMLKQKLNKDKAESKIKRGRKKMEDNFRRMTGEGGRGARGGWEEVREKRIRDRVGYEKAVKDMRAALLLSRGAGGGDEGGEGKGDKANLDDVKLTVGRMLFGNGGPETMRGVATPMAGLMESTKTPMGKKTPVGMKSPKGHKSADRYATSGTGPAPSNHKKKVGGRMVNEAKSRGVDSIMSRCDDFLNPGVMYSTVGTKTRTPKSGWGQEMDYEEKGREALERAKRRFGGGQDGHRRGKKGGDEDKKGVVPAANGSQPETPGSSTTAEAKETSAGGKVQDPRSLLKAKAGRVWGDIKNMTRTHLDKQGDSVTKQVSETIKVVRGDDDAQQQRPQEGEDHRRHPQHAPIESVGNVNSRYFAAKQQPPKGRAFDFMSFDAVLNMKTEQVGEDEGERFRRTMEVYEDKVRKEEEMKRKKEAKLNIFDPVEKVMGKRGRRRTSVVDIKKVLEEGGAVGKGERGEPDMDDLIEWQMLHVGICEDIKGKMESLPNLNGVKGKGRYAKRHPPSLISLSD